MLKRFFLLTLTAIVVLVGATSCDKDTYQETDVKFYKFVDANTIAIYDDLDGNLYETERRTVELQLTAELIPYPLSNVTQPLAFAEGETGTHRLYLNDMYDDSLGEDFKSAKDYFEFTFKFNIQPLSVRGSGFNINSDDQLLICFDPLILKAEIKSIKLIDEPFYQKVQVVYSIITEDSKIVVATTTQDIELGIQPENLDDEPMSESDDDETDAEDNGNV